MGVCGFRKIRCRQFAGWPKHVEIAFGTPNRNGPTIGEPMYFGDRAWSANQPPQVCEAEKDQHPWPDRFKLVR